MRSSSAPSLVNGPGVSQRAEGLGWIKRETAEIAQRAGRRLVVIGTVCVGRVLNHAQPVPPRNRQNWFHLAWLPVEMYRDDGAGALRDSCFQQVRVHIECVRFHIDEDGRSSDVGNGKG